jgi:hypothetical protein
MPFSNGAVCPCGGPLRVTDVAVPDGPSVRAVYKCIKNVMMPNPDKELHVYRIRRCFDCGKRIITFEQPIADLEPKEDDGKVSRA